jgi:hypothetical protein
MGAIDSGIAALLSIEPALQSVRSALAPVVAMADSFFRVSSPRLLRALDAFASLNPTHARADLRQAVGFMHGLHRALIAAAVDARHRTESGLTVVGMAADNGVQALSRALVRIGGGADSAFSAVVLRVSSPAGVEALTPNLLVVHPSVKVHVWLDL